MKKKNGGKKSIYALGILAVLLVGAITVMGFVWQQQKQDIVATIAGHTITQDELDFYKELLRGDVQNYYQKEYKVSLSGDAWMEVIGETTPEEYLREKSLERCRESKALFLEAREEGFLTFVDYEDFLASMEAENTSRKNAIAQGEIVYGLTKFTPQQYLSHLEEQLRTSLINKLSKEETSGLFVNEAEVKQYFQQHTDEWTANVEQKTIIDIFTEGKEKEKEETLEQAARQLRQYAKQNEDLMDHFTELPKIIKTKEKIFTNETYNQDIHADPEILSMLNQMKEGELSEQMELETGYHIVYFKEYIVDKEQAYEEYAQRIHDFLVEQKLAHYLEEFSSSLEIVVY